MSCGYKLEDLLALLCKQAPTKVDAVTRHRRRVESGLLSVGLKIHYLGNGRHFDRLVDGLGGRWKVLEINHYKDNRASLCLVLPPLGNAPAAITLLECIEQVVEAPVFNNPDIQLQVCSPGRLASRRAALLAITFYLGSDTLRRYSLGDLTTSFSTDACYPRGRRLVLYDADGDFDRSFDWWTGSGAAIRVEGQFPFSSGRSDLLAGSASRLDIQNINLLATLLVHAEYGGYWSRFAREFEKEMELLLDKHLLLGLLEAPWVRTDNPSSHDDERFFSALQELVAYALDEAARLKARGAGSQSTRSSAGILHEVQSLLYKYRHKLMNQSQLIAGGDQP